MGGGDEKREKGRREEEEGEEEGEEDFALEWGTELRIEMGTKSDWRQKQHLFSSVNSLLQNLKRDFSPLCAHRGKT